MPVVILRWKRSGILMEDGQYCLSSVTVILHDVKWLY